MTLLKLLAKKSQLEAIMLTVLNVSDSFLHPSDRKGDAGYDSLQHYLQVIISSIMLIRASECAAGKHICSEDVHKARIQATPHITIASRPCWSSRRAHWLRDPVVTSW